MEHVSMTRTKHTSRTVGIFANEGKCFELRAALHYWYVKCISCAVVLRDDIIEANTTRDVCRMRNTSGRHRLSTFRIQVFTILKCEAHVNCRCDRHPVISHLR